MAWLTALTKRVEHREVDLDGVLQAIVDRATAVVQAERGTFYLRDNARNELVSRVAHLPEIREVRLRLGQGVAGWVAEHGRSLRAERHDPRFAQHVDGATGFSTRDLLAVPVKDASGEIVGVLQALNRVEGTFAPQDQAALEELAKEVADLIGHTSLRAQLHRATRQPLAFRFNFVVGDGPEMQALYGRVERAAPRDVTVLIRGETGTGKGLFARAIHFNSPRADGPFVGVDCAALPEQLIENELFGHERGAFTGADRASEGQVAAAEGGTLFLDEVGELSPSVQGKLLRLVQDRAYLQVGGTRSKRANVRFLCATHRDLEEMVRQGLFREDLYYRLKVVELTLPPLRARGHADLDRLIDHFLFEFAMRHKRPAMQVSDAARAGLHGHSWPGNVRELEHAIESAVVLAPTALIRPEDLSLRALFDRDLFSTKLAPLRAVEEAYLRWALSQCGGNQSETARALGIGRNTLARKLREDGESGED
jgi:Nif-specific regulatory protein